jgi:hypothetical protein
MVALILTIAMSAHLKPAMALEIGAGPMVWYSWWHPVFEPIISGQYRNNENKKSFNSSYRMDPSFLVGGAFTARGAAWGTRWSVYTTFLWGGWYHATGGYYTYNFDTSKLKWWSEEYKIRKYDFDCNASYSFTYYFKIFLGAKVQGYTIRKNQIQYNLTDGTIPNGYIRNLHQLGAGPGIGVGFTLPIGSNFFILWNISAIYMRAWFITPGTNTDPRELYRYYNLYGGNTTLSIAYVIVGADVTLNLGFRYQYLYYWYDARSTADRVEAAPRDGKTDQFYGITFSALYNITLF